MVAAHNTTTPAELILGRLDSVRRTGSGWVARCPAHDDRTPSLSVGVGDDGRVLLHCWSGCAALAVVQAVGLCMADLFPEPRAQHTPSDRRQARARAREAGVRAAAGVLAAEAMVVWLAADDVARGRRLPDTDMARLVVAADRIADARRELGP